MGWYTYHAAGFMGSMAAPAGPLHQPGNPFGAANLNDEVHRRKIDAQIKAGGADHRFPLIASQSSFHRITLVAVKRPMMQSQPPRPVRACFLNCLKPYLRLGPRVGENECAGGGLNFGQYLGQEFQTKMSGPGKPFDLIGQKGFHHQRFRLETVNQQSAVGGISQKHPHSGVDVAKRR